MLRMEVKLLGVKISRDGLSGKATISSLMETKERSLLENERK